MSKNGELKNIKDRLSRKADVDRSVRYTISVPPCSENLEPNKINQIDTRPNDNEIIDAEIMVISNTETKHMDSLPENNIPESGRLTGVRILSFLAFVVLGSGAWGWGPFASFIFALCSSALLAKWLKRWL